MVKELGLESELKPEPNRELGVESKLVPNSSKRLWPHPDLNTTWLHHGANPFAS